MEGTLHLIAIRRHKNKYERYQNINPTLPVTGRCSNLESILIPFGEEVAVCANKLNGTVPLENEIIGYQNVNQDKYVMGLMCFLKQQAL